MRYANLDGRLSLLIGTGYVDVERASGGRFSADPQAVYARWEEFATWAGTVADGESPLSERAVFGPPVPRPSQVFAIGLNYQLHIEETGGARPGDAPVIFTKFPTCITGPQADVVLPTPFVDWEVELVVVMGRLARNVAAADAWSYAAGITLGQDLSERVVQMAARPPQFSLGKSYPGFGPIGPSVVTIDELPNPDDVELGCAIDGEVVQQGRTKDMILSVPQQIAYLSAVLPLLPGDLIFTGTPDGVGFSRQPPRFLAAGQTLTSYAEGIGELHNRMVAMEPSDGDGLSEGEADARRGL